MPSIVDSYIGSTTRQLGSSQLFKYLIFFLFTSTNLFHLYFIVESYNWKKDTKWYMTYYIIHSFECQDSFCKFYSVNITEYPIYRILLTVQTDNDIMS